MRAATPDVPLTTNLMGTFSALDYHAWAREMDIVSWDCYPAKDAPFSQVAFSHALMRGLKEGQPWLLMEQTPSQQNWQAQCALKRPGILRLWSFQAIAHGSESVMYFQWRRTRGGIEKFHGAVIEHVGTPNTRVFREVAELGAELKQLGTQTLGGRVQARVALLFSWEVWWAVSYASGPSQNLKYLEQCQAMFSALHEQGIVCDIVSPQADLEGYKVVLAPVFYMVQEGIAFKLEEFVRAGGSLVATFFSGIADECDSVHLGGYPGPLRALLGLWVEEVDALRPDERNFAVFEDSFGEVSGSAPCGLLCERVHLEGARALAVYGQDFYEGEPVVTCHQFGRGQAYYLASALEEAPLKGVLREVCARAEVLPVLPEVAPGLEVMPRVGSNGSELLYLLNHNAAPLEVALPQGGFFDLLTGRSHQGRLELPRLGVAILRAK